MKNAADQSLRLLRTIAAFGLAFAVAAAASSAELVVNGDVEGPFVHGIARGWVNNCYGDNTMVFSPGAPHAGTSSQQIACQAFNNGAAQLYCPLHLIAGKHYKVSVAMRAEGVVGPISVGLRRCPAPYTMHLSASLEAGPEWKTHVFEGDIPSSDDRAGLFLSWRPEAGAKLWIDDVSVIESEPTCVALPTPTGNVLPNADMELAFNGDWQCTGEKCDFDAENPFHGRRSLHWRLNSNHSQLNSRAIEFGGNNQPFTLALAARASGSATVTAEVFPATMADGVKPLLRVECQPGRQWKVFRGSETLPTSCNGAYWMRIRVASHEAADVWLDAVRLEPGNGEKAFHCRRPIEAALVCAPVAHIYRPGKPVELGLQAFCDGDQPQSTSWRCRITDYYRNAVAEVPVQLELKPRVAVATQVKIPLKKTGVFLAELLDGDETLCGVSFSMLPPPSSTPAAQSLIGGHFRLDEFHMQAANAMGIRWTRIHDCETITHWNTVEPKKGQFVWNDDKVQVARRHGVQILGELFRVPAWASSADAKVKDGSELVYPPRDMHEFEAYVRAVVGHYHNDIHCWEIWNEPYWTGFWRGTPEQLAALAKTAAQTVHEVDPSATVLAPCTAPAAATWIQKALAAGMLDGVQVFGFHGYDMLSPSGYATVQQWARYGRQKPLPIWNTETGTTSETFCRPIPDKYSDNYTRWLGNVSYRTAAEITVKSLVMSLACNAERYFQYWTVHEESLPRLSAMSLFEYDGSLRPMGAAYAVAASLLDGGHCRGGLPLHENVLSVCLQQRNRLIVVLWRREAMRPKPYAISTAAEGIEARDMMGNPVPLKGNAGGFTVDLGSEPLYLVASREKQATLEHALTDLADMPTKP